MCLRPAQSAIRISGEGEFPGRHVGGGGGDAAGMFIREGGPSRARNRRRRRERRGWRMPCPVSLTEEGSEGMEGAKEGSDLLGGTTRASKRRASVISMARPSSCAKGFRILCSTCIKHVCGNGADRLIQSGAGVCEKRAGDSILDTRNARCIQPVHTKRETGMPKMRSSEIYRGSGWRETRVHAAAHAPAG